MLELFVFIPLLIVWYCIFCLVLVLPYLSLLCLTIVHFHFLILWLLPFIPLSFLFINSHQNITPYFFSCTSLWAAVGGGSRDAGPGHIFHSVPLHAGSPPHCSGALLPPRPQVQHQEHPFKHSCSHVFVWAGVSAWGQSDWTTGKHWFGKGGCVLVFLLPYLWCFYFFAFCFWAF